MTATDTKVIHYATGTDKETGNPVLWVSLDGQRYLQADAGGRSPTAEDYSDIAALFGPQPMTSTDEIERPRFIQYMTVARRALEWLSNDVQHREPIPA